MTRGWDEEPDPLPILLELVVEVCDPDPVGVLLGPDEAPLAVVYPDRPPVGFVPATHHQRRPDLT